MAMVFEELKVLQAAEQIADGVWNEVSRWDDFSKEVVGKQIARAADSIGANIAEAYGRFHYGERLQFFYYARGSLFETKYWLNRIHARDLMPQVKFQTFIEQISGLAHQINTVVMNTKNQRRGRITGGEPSRVRESQAEYLAYGVDHSFPFFDQEDLEWLQSPHPYTLPPNYQLPNY
ncbi:MAG: hypothetical protein Fur0022_19220 [Anaerolineales bacterium]